MAALDTIELERLIVLMHEMLGAASNANWQALTRLDIERRALLKYEPAASVSDASGEFAGVHPPNNGTRQGTVLAQGAQVDTLRESLVAEIRTLDEQIISTVQAERQKLLVENRELSAQVKAKNRYAQTSSMT